MSQACESIEVSPWFCRLFRQLLTRRVWYCFYVSVNPRLTVFQHSIRFSGPALFAFTLMCAAYSLRTWRRNGVACDELLFLPGTPHGQSHGIDSPPVVEMTPPPQRNEGDAAAGIGIHRNRTEELVPLAANVVESVVESPKQEVSLLKASSNRILYKSQSAPVPLQAMEEGRENHPEEASWDGNDSETEAASNLSEEKSPARPDMICSSPQHHTVSEMSLASQEEEVETEQEEEFEGQNDFDRFRENHPRITRIGTFFFFRSAAVSAASQNATYAPSGPSVFGAALDLCMPVLFNFHLFIEAYNHMADGDEMTAKILPLIFLSVLIVRSFIPPSRRGRFWSTVKFTAMAPFYKVRFRDAFLGDVLTSLVRPIQDVLFALSYYSTVIWGMVFGSYGLTEAGLILERSWFLHNVILPSCALLPLWWKFLQTLRQSYDANKRWPYFGDSFKYLSAAMVIVYGMTHPEDRRSSWWLLCFILTVIYQIAWDTIVDWELFVITPRTDRQPVECQSSCCVSSLRPSSHILLTMQMYLLQPIADSIRRITAVIPSWDQIQLRPKRLYKNDHFYYRIFIVNALLRFTWMLCFIPAYRLSSVSGEEKQTTFSSDVNSYIGVLLPLAEIIRRCYWGFLKVEMETIRLMDSDVLYTRVDDGTDEEEYSEKERSLSFRQRLPTWLETEQRQRHDAAVSSSKSRLARAFECSDGFLHRLFLAELTLWAGAFVGFGYWAACE